MQHFCAKKITFLTLKTMFWQHHFITEMERKRGKVMLRCVCATLGARGSWPELSATGWFLDTACYVAPRGALYVMMHHLFTSALAPICLLFFSGSRLLVLQVATVAMVGHFTHPPGSPISAQGLTCALCSVRQGASSQHQSSFLSCRLILRQVPILPTLLCACEVKPPLLLTLCILLSLR